MNVQMSILGSLASDRGVPRSEHLNDARDQGAQGVMLVILEASLGGDSSGISSRPLSSSVTQFDICRSLDIDFLK